jgi:hypothetical protein
MKVIAPGDVEIELGELEAAPTIGIIDYSRRDTDDFGVTKVVERGFARRMSVRISLPTDSVDAVQRSLADLRAVPAQWVADEDFAWLNFEGFYKDFSLDLAIPPVSFCSLTVEGLAETETVADTGVDPAPEGITSSLLLLQPVTLTGAMLAASNVAETDYPEWSALTTYPAAARVILAATHRIYESAAAGNLNNNPSGESGLWFDVGPTNRWAMFDQALGTVTSRSDSIAVTLAAGTVNAVGLLDVVGATIRVQTTGYDETKAVAGGSVNFLDLPGLDDDVIVTISGTGTVSAGTLVIGTLVALGVTEESPTAGITDFSRKEVDDFGEATIVPRAWAKRMSAAALISTDAVDVVANRIAAVRAKPSLWIADDGTDSLTLYGFFKDFSIEIGETVSKLGLTLEGLSEAMPFGADFQGLSIIEKTVYQRAASAPATPTGGSYDFSTRTTTPPSGWSATLPSGTDPAWASTATAAKEGMGGSAPFGDWSAPVVAFANGVDGTDGLDGSNGTDGTDGTDGADGKLVEFVWRRAASLPATPTGDGIPSGWSDDPPSGADPLWMSKAKQELTGVLVSGESWSTPIRHDGPAGANGLNGAAGSNSAVVYLYQRSATAPAAPTGTFTYTFTTGILSGGTPGSWTQVIPAADGNPLWVIAATASANTATDSIPAAEFTSPILKDGAGLNAATVFLYQRAASAPTAPGSTTTYTFSTGVLSGTLGSWTQTVPAFSANPLYVITATALAAGATDTIASGEWSAVRVLAENGADGSPGSPGTPGVSPVNALAVPANKQFTADSDGTIKAGQLPFNVAIDGYKAGATISGTVSILAVSGCTATAISGGFTIDTVFADAGFVTWRFTASDGQVVDNKMSFSRQRDPASGGQVSINFSSTSWWGSGSYGATGPSTVLPASSTGQLAIAGYASFYCSGNGEARLTAKLQYRAVGSGTWLDSGFTSGPSVALKTPDFPGEPGENSPGEVAPFGTLTGLTANGSYEVQMVGSRNASYNGIASATGFITLRQVL